MVDVTTWEYRIVDLGRVRESKIEGELNGLGAEGWEIVTIFGKAGNLAGGLTKAIAVLKRPVGP